MQRIQGLVSDQRELALQVLSWITRSQRPLSAIELQHALAVEIGETAFNPDNLSDIEDMISVCAGLVTVDEQTHVIRLVHHTTQEYFERTWQTWFSNAHYNIATACLTYLRYDVFESGVCVSDDDIRLCLQGYPLYSYSSINLDHRVRHQPVEMGGFQEFLTNNSTVSACSQVLLREEKNAGGIEWSQRVLREVFGVHLVAYLGQQGILHDLIKKGFSHDSKVSNNRTSLFWAAANGQEGTSKQLLEAGTNPDDEDLDARTPLSRAAGNGHDAVIVLLLKYRANADKRDNSCETPLLWAARRGHNTAVKLLLEAGAEPDPKDNEYGLTALSWACGNGNFEVVKLLLEKAANPVCKDVDGWAPLFWAVHYGAINIVRLVLDQGVDANATDNYGLSPLSIAAEYNLQAVITLLKGKGTCHVDGKVKHPKQLFHAVYHVKSNYTEFLLQSGVDTNMTAAEKRISALSMAAWMGNAEVGEHLLYHNAEVNYQNPHHGKPALSVATYKGHGEVVKHSSLKREKKKKKKRA